MMDAVKPWVAEVLNLATTSYHPLLRKEKLGYHTGKERTSVS